MDSFFLKAIGLELQSAITGARIGRPWLEDSFRIIFPLTISGNKVYLYCSCHPSLPVLYLMEEEPSFEDKGREQAEPLIRKYVTGADITEINVVDMERILIFRLQVDSRHRDLPPDYPRMNLIFEIMGRYSNVILTSDQGPSATAKSSAASEQSADIAPVAAIGATTEPLAASGSSALIAPVAPIESPSTANPPAPIVHSLPQRGRVGVRGFIEQSADIGSPAAINPPDPSALINPSATMGKILAALRYIPSYKNRYRQILLGHTYRFPPPPKGKIDPQSLTEEIFSQLQAGYDGTIPWPEFLHRTVAGLDLLVAQEIWHRARSRSKSCGEKKALWIAFREILEIYRQGAFSPRILHFEDGAVRLFSFPLEQYPPEQNPDDQPCANKPCTDQPCADRTCTDQPCADRTCTDRTCTDQPCADRTCTDQPCMDEPLSPSPLWERAGVRGFMDEPIAARKKQETKKHTDQVFKSASEAAGYFERIEQKYGAAQALRDLLGQKVRLALERAKVRQSALENDFQKADQAQEYRQKGDIITAHLHRLKKGMDQLEAENFFDLRQLTSITIPLDPLLTPVQNAQAYYKKYAKAKKSLDIVMQRLEAVQEEIDFLLSLQGKIEAEGTLSLLHEYADLLKEKGIFQPEGRNFPASQRTGTAEKQNAGRQNTSRLNAGGQHARGQNGGRTALKDIRRYMSVDGLEILVGKNDRGNDALTCRVAQKDDLWFHTQDVPGSHVLVRNPERLSQIPFSTVLQAASLAAYYSKARNDTKVAVDYTFRKYITKPKGARPGLVLMTRKSTVLVPPQCL